MALHLSDLAYCVLILKLNLQKAVLFLFPPFPGSFNGTTPAPLFLLPVLHFPFLNLMGPQQQPKTRSVPSSPAITSLGIYLKT